MTAAGTASTTSTTRRTTGPAQKDALTTLTAQIDGLIQFPARKPLDIIP